LIGTDGGNEFELEFIRDVSALHADQNSVALHANLQVILKQDIELLRLYACRVAHADRPLITTLAACDPGRHQPVKFKSLVSAPPIHLRRIIAAGIEREIDANGCSCPHATPPRVTLR